MTDMMTVAGARARVAEIQQAAGLDDFGQAHYLEDVLRADVLRTVLAETPMSSYAAALITIALSTDEIRFERATA